MRRTLQVVAIALTVVGARVGAQHVPASAPQAFESPAPAAALDQATQPPPPPPAPPAQGPQPRPVPPTPPPPPPPGAGIIAEKIRLSSHNVRVEVVLTEQGSLAPPNSKTVTITTTDGNWGKIRSSVHSRSYGGAPLNIDARPTVTGDGRVLLQITLEYSQGRNADAEGNTDRISNLSINESATVLLDNAKPLTISQSADPIGDRKVTVEVKATVLK